MAINKYIKKPIVIDAVQWDGTFDQASEVIKFSKGFAFVSNDLNLKRNYLKILTLEGVFIISPKDYIIKGVSGEFYSVKEEIFNLTYSEYKE